MWREGDEYIVTTSLIEAVSSRLVTQIAISSVLFNSLRTQSVFAPSETKHYLVFHSPSHHISYLTHTQPHKLLKPFQNVTLQPILQHDSRRPTRSLPTFFRKLHATTPLRLPVILQHNIDPTLMSQLDDHKYDKSIVLCLCGRGPSGL